MSTCRKLEFDHQAFQVLVDGSLVQVLADRDQANAYAEKFYKGYSVIIVPIPIFSYS